MQKRLQAHSNTQKYIQSHTLTSHLLMKNKDSFTTIAGKCKEGIKARYKGMREVEKKSGRGGERCMFSPFTESMAGLWDSQGLVGI